MSTIIAHETLLNRLARADGVLKQVELETIRTILEELAKAQGFKDAGEGKSRSYLSTETLGAITELSARPLRDREKLIQLLWVVAMCDGELHPREEEMIYRFADALNVSRAAVARQQPDL